MLSFGLHSAPEIFTMLTDTLEWILWEEGMSSTTLYLDDFTIMGPPHSPKCAHDLATLCTTCERLGVPLAPEKVIGLTTCLTFLGIQHDTHALQMWLPPEKLSRLMVRLAQWPYK